MASIPAKKQQLEVGEKFSMTKTFETFYFRRDTTSRFSSQSKKERTRFAEKLHEQKIRRISWAARPSC